MKKFLLALALLGCSDAPDPQPRPAATPAPAPAPAAWLATDSQAYTLHRDGEGWTANIGVTYNNTGKDTVYVVNCNGAVVMDLQQRADTGWTNVLFGVSNECLSEPIVILPGAVHRDTIQIWGAEQGTTSFPAFETTDFSAEFRLIWHQPVLHYQIGVPHFGTVLPDSLRVSNPFMLRRAVTRG